MKKPLVNDILQVTVLYVVFGILTVIFENTIPGLLVILIGYLINIVILLFFEHREAQKQFRTTLTQYETLLPPHQWTRVYLNPDISEKIGVSYGTDFSSGKFYAQTDSHTSWAFPVLTIRVAIIPDNAEITPETSSQIS